MAVAGRPDGLLASAGADGRVILWTTRPSTNTLTDPSIEAASRVGFSQDGRRLMVADGNGVVLFDVARRARLGQLDGPADAAITPDGRTVATGGVGSVVALYDLDSRKLEGRLRWAPRQLRVATFGVEISPDGRQLVEKSQLLRPGKKQGELGYKEQYLVVWDLPGRRTLRRLRIGPPAFYGLDTDSDLAFSPDSRVLAYARDDSAKVGDPDLDRVALWDTRDRRELEVVDAPGVEALAFGRGGDVLALGFIDRVELRDAHHPGSVLQTIRVPKWTAQNLAVSPDGRLLATSGSQGALLWELGRPGDLPVLAGTLVDRQDLGSGGLDSDVAFSPDGRHLAVADDGSEIYLWDLDAGSWTQTLCHMLDRGFTGPERRRFFPDGRVPPTCEG
jgi:WD40 repeat protein